MKPLGILALAAQFAPRFLQIRRSAWIAGGLGLLAMLALLVWAAVALSGWLWGQGKVLAGGAPEAVRTVVTEVGQQVEQVVPGAREVLGEWLPARKPESPPRDVSGADIGPMARYPGLVRSLWQNDGSATTVRYEGRADYAAVLDHYAKGFSAQGYTQRVVSAAPEGEEHEYRKGEERIRFVLAQLPQGRIAATLVAYLP